MKEYEKVKTLLEQRHHAKARRKSSATTFEMVNNPKSSTRYRRRQETRNILEFIHGGSRVQFMVLGILLHHVQKKRSWKN